MIKKLIVKKFVIIEDISVDFKDGMTVITGETGAGKSLIIDTITLLLGDRADTDMIRDGFDSAEIIGIFSYNNKLDDIFNKYGIKISDEIKVERIISKSKNIIKINDTNQTLQALK